MVSPSTVAIRFRLIGPFCATDANGDAVTPKGAKAQGLLALLLTAPGYERPRAYLQDKLWSDRGPEQGAQSLRQCLSEIRRALGRDRDVLITVGNRVRLDAARVRSDLENDLSQVRGQLGDDTELLEGLVIRDQEFEDWLRDRQMEFEDRLGTAANRLDDQAPARLAPVCPVLTLDDSVTSDGSAITLRTTGQRLRDEIAKGLSEWSTLDVLDSACVTATPPPGVIQRLSQSTLAIGERIAVGLRHIETDSGRLLWSATHGFERADFLDPDSKSVNTAVCSGIDRMLFELTHAEKQSAERGMVLTSGFEAIFQIFSRDQAALETARRQLSLCHEADGRGIHLAWLGFICTYQIGERHSVDRQSVVEEAHGLVCRAVELEPHNPIALALASYVHTFLRHDYFTGYELAERSVAVRRANPLGLAFLGAANFYLGRFDEATELTRRARALSGNGPYRYLINMLCCIAATLSGRLEDAIRFGEATYAQAPDYSAPLRYLVAVYTKLGDESSAARCLDRLLRHEPDFSLAAMRDPDYPMQALRRSGFFDFQQRQEI